jgi:hypothetical protein
VAQVALEAQVRLQEQVLSALLVASEVLALLVALEDLERSW